MTLDKFTQFACFEIFSRRYHDNRVLLKANKVSTHNKVLFSKDTGFGSAPYYISGKTVKKYPKVSNGAIMCYEVPVDEFEPLQLSERSTHEYA